MRVKMNPMTDEDIIDRSLAREPWQNEKERMAQLRASPLACLHALLIDLYGDDHTWEKSKELWIWMAEIGADYMMRNGNLTEMGVIPIIVLDGSGRWGGVASTELLDKGPDEA